MSSIDGTKMPDKADESSSSTAALEQYLQSLKHQLKELNTIKRRLESSQKLLESGSRWIDFLTSKRYQDQKDKITQLDINTSESETKMRANVKELFEMVLDMTMEDVMDHFHYELGKLAIGNIPSTNGNEPGENMTSAGQDQIEKQRGYMDDQEIRNRQILFDKTARDLLSHAMTGMETRIEQLKEMPDDGRSCEETSGDDVNGASQEEIVTASTA